MLKLKGLSLAVLVAAGGALAVAYSQGRMTPPKIVQEYAGDARVLDGDTLHVAGERIRLTDRTPAKWASPIEQKPPVLGMLLDLDGHTGPRGAAKSS